MPHQAPDDPIKAVTHPDPYPYYAELAARHPLYRDRGLDMWVASGAAEVTAVLESPSCLVRPLDEPVPRPLAGTSAGDIFGSLVRMVDGEPHDRMKAAVVNTMERLDVRSMSGTASAWAHHLIARGGWNGARGIGRFAHDLPVYTIASLLGADPGGLGEIAALTGSFVRGISPAASPGQRAVGNRAAKELQARFASVLSPSTHRASDGLIAVLAQEVRRGSPEAVDAVLPNAIGFLSQAFEATAALILNTLRTLARHRSLRDAVHEEPALMPALVEEVLRFDPPVHNTRRYVARDVTIADQPVEKDASILVLLAAANYDPSVNPAPEIFDLHRVGRALFTFGLGAHGCAGTALATAIAASGVQELLATGLDLSFLAKPLRYLPSGNIRLPMLDAE